MQTNRTITLVLAALAAISLHLVTATMLTSIRTAAADAVPSWALETCPAKRNAMKALAGVYGPLQEWQRVAYTQFVTHEPVARVAWTTTYYPPRFPRGQKTRWGFPVDERCAAANELPAFSFVWHPQVGVRQVLDTGADWNDCVARERVLTLPDGRRVDHSHRAPADHWLDLWEPRRGSLGIGAQNMVWYAAPPRQPVQWKYRKPPKHRWLEVQ